MLYKFSNGALKVADELKDQRVVTMMSHSELGAIDDWMFKNRIRSRGEAIRRLCQMGIVAEGTPLMERAMNVLAHYTEAKNDGSLQPFRSGKSLEVDVKRLCWAVLQQQSSMVGFKSDKTVDDAMAAAERLKDDYEKTAAGTHLDDN